MKKNTKKDDIVAYVSGLAKLNPNEADAEILRNQVKSTIKYISALSEVDTEGVKPTSQVTGLKNIFREDTIDRKRVLSQEEALSNAPRTHNGYFVVKGIFED